MADLDPEFLSILCCPLSHAALVQDGETLVSTDPATRRRYPITEGFPVLLIEEAEELPDAAWQEIMKRLGASPSEAGDNEGADASA